MGVSRFQVLAPGRVMSSNCFGKVSTAISHKPLQLDESQICVPPSHDSNNVRRAVAFTVVQGKCRNFQG
jgi:hypothetical protein